MIPEPHLFSINWDAVADVVSVIAVVIVVPFWAFLLERSRKEHNP